MKTSFTIPLRPKAKERPRHTGHVTYTPKATRDFEKAVRLCYQAQNGGPPTDKPVILTIGFNFAIPKSVSSIVLKRLMLGTTPYSSRPDLDNIEKAIMDALNGIAYADDALIVGKVTLKRFWTENSVEVIIEEMEEFDYEGIFADLSPAGPHLA